MPPLTFRCSSSRLALLGMLALCTAHCDSLPPPDVTVQPGQSIQEMIDSMPAEATRWIVAVQPGVYNETLSIDRSGIELRGVVSGDGPEDRPVLDGKRPADGTLLKDAVIATGAHFTISGFALRNYAGNGVTVLKTHDVTLRDLWLDNTGRYGLYPYESEDILIENCSATNMSDSGLYVGQSRRAVVRSNKVFNNVTGIEIENTVDAIVENNDVTHNTAGILAFVLPNNPSKIAQTCVIQNNRIVANNHPNFGDKTAIVSLVPAGTGIAVMGADQTVIKENEITGNHSVGIGVVNVGLLIRDPSSIDVEPNSDGTQILNNRYRDNGNMPDKALKENGFMLGGDILWDGTGKGNCQDEPQSDELRFVGIQPIRC